MSTHGKPMYDPEIQQALHEWWLQQSAKGDPSKRPNFAEDAFAAGFRAGRNFDAAASDLFRAIVYSDDARWTPSMRAAMAKATGGEP